VIDRRGFIVGTVSLLAAPLSAAAQQPAVPVIGFLSSLASRDRALVKPSRFELVVNLKTAKTLGLTVPQSVLLQADEVVQ
jgi:putative ABC transport system substrate-binding protein